jgi:hypothetical protein
MVRCADCGKLIDLDDEMSDFLDFIDSEHPDDDRFSSLDPEPFGQPLCCSCMVETYDSIYYDVD